MVDFYVIACAAVLEELRNHLRDGVPVRELEMGLHRNPATLREALQTEIDKAPSGLTVLLGYGLCGKAADGLVARNNRLVIPRVHDCIALFLGSREEHQKQIEQEAGTYYLTKGFLESENDLLGQYDQMVKKYGAERGAKIARRMLSGYTRLALINTGNYRIEKYRKLACDMAELYSLRFEELPGSPELLQDLIAGHWDHRYLVVEPGATISMMDFL